MRGGGEGGGEGEGRRDGDRREEMDTGGEAGRDG